MIFILEVQNVQNLTIGELEMPELIDPSEIMFTPFEPKTKNRYVMYIEGLPAYLIKTAARPQITFKEIVLAHINVKRCFKGKG